MSYATAGDVGLSAATVFLINLPTGLNLSIRAACGWSVASLTASIALRIFDTFSPNFIVRSVFSAGLVFGLITSKEVLIQNILIDALKGIVSACGVYGVTKWFNVVTITAANYARTICGLPNRPSNDGLVFQ